MTKEEKIKEAFGKSWNLLTHSMQYHILNVHHWVDRSRNRMDLSPKDLGFDETTECEIHCEFWRPSQLKGIENNNGWIKIDKREDLPTVYSFYNACYLDGKKDVPMFYAVNLPTLLLDYEQGLITHYRPIEFPKPPLF